MSTNSNGIFLILRTLDLERERKRRLRAIRQLFRLSARGR